VYTWSAARRGNFRFLRWLLLPSCIAVAVATAAFLSGMDAYIGAVIAAAAFAIGLVVSGFVQAHEIRFVLRSMVSPTGRSEK
jgi:hypothetical protein